MRFRLTTATLVVYSAIFGGACLVYVWSSQPLKATQPADCDTAYVLAQAAWYYEGQSLAAAYDALSHVNSVCPPPKGNWMPMQITAYQTFINNGNMAISSAGGHVANAIAWDDMGDSDAAAGNDYYDFGLYDSAQAKYNFARIDYNFSRDHWDIAKGLYNQAEQAYDDAREYYATH